MPSLPELATAWRGRPLDISRRLWALTLVLDRLPWPVGEELLARALVVSALVGTRGWRRALAWVSAQPGRRGGRWRAARSLCANNGRFIARFALVGLHEPDLVERRFALRGERHLEGAGRGVVFVGFHVGPRNAHLALRIAGHSLTWIGGHTTAAAWSPKVRARLHRREDLVPPTTDHLRDGHVRVGLLYRARRILLDGGSVFIGADGVGSEVFSIPLPGGSMAIRSGWHTLSAASGAPVFPVLSHMEDRVQVVTVHPALPAADGDPVRHLESCRLALRDLLGDYVRRFPEQCPMLAFAR